MKSIGLLPLLLLAGAPLQEPPPFAAGEILEYSARWNLLRPGRATLQVVARDTLDGLPAWQFAFQFRVSALGLFENETELTSWTTADPFSSRRFRRRIAENGRERTEDYRIYPDSGYYRAHEDTVRSPTPADPVDDLAFIYLLRTTPLVVGQTYQYTRYWRAAVNPVVVRVIGRNQFTMPDGSKVPCLVLHPVVDEQRGMFARRARARLWLTDHSRRLPVQSESTYPFGTVRLVLTAVTLGGQASGPR